jgi:hypothetical protein
MTPLRSLLFVPADSERKLARAGGADADAVILDLEDSVPPDRKTAARGLAREYLQNHSGQPVWVRVNDLVSGELLRDLAALTAVRPEGIVLPKIRGPEDVATVAHYLEALEFTNAVDRPIPILALVTETPIAVLRMGDLASAALPRLMGIGWGAEDLSAALGAGNPRLPSGAWRYTYEHARSQCLLAGHRFGVRRLSRCGRARGRLRRLAGRRLHGTLRDSPGPGADHQPGVYRQRCRIRTRPAHHRRLFIGRRRGLARRQNVRHTAPEGCAPARELTSRPRDAT